MGDVAELLDRIWRTEAAGMLGALSRRLGDFDRAEEALRLRAAVRQGRPGPTCWPRSTVRSRR